MSGFLDSCGGGEVLLILRTLQGFEGVFELSVGLVLTRCYDHEYEL